MYVDRKLPNLRHIVEEVQQGTVTPLAHVLGSMETIKRFESDVRAWAFVDTYESIARGVKSINTSGPLAGVPIGIKDVIDVAGMPTRHGSAAPPPHESPFDACCVGLLRAAGAIPIGKTVTAEYAFRHPGPTRNPHNLEHTPGGSSSGSAAAVAAGMVPAALATQTGSSIIRPAAFCGVVGFKPSFSSVLRDGMKMTCESLDVIGWYGRIVEDAIVLGKVLSTLETSVERPHDHPLVAIPRNLGLLDDTAQAALSDARHAFEWGGGQCMPWSLTAEAQLLMDAHHVIMAYELARSVAPVARQFSNDLSATLLDTMRIGLAIPGARYQEMRVVQSNFRNAWHHLFGAADFILSPSTPGVAPAGLNDTGTSTFNKIWSLLGWPSIHIPTGKAKNGLPIGVQLIGKWQSDFELLAWAQWFQGLLHKRLPDG